MEFKISAKSLPKWQNMMNEMGIESQMSEEALIKKRLKEEAEKVKRDIEHLEHLKKYHFKSAQEMINYIYNGNEMFGENTFMGSDIIKLMDNGEVGHYSFWLDEYDAPLGYFWKIQPKEYFEKWVNKISQEDHLDQGYLPYWHKKL